MKILSIRQPWAHLIVRGSKNIENRSWPTRYPGPFLVHASLNIDREACRAHGIDPAKLQTGGVVGVAENNRLRGWSQQPMVSGTIWICASESSAAAVREVDGIAGAAKCS